MARGRQNIAVQVKQAQCVNDHPKAYIQKWQWTNA